MHLCSCWFIDSEYVQRGKHTETYSKSSAFSFVVVTLNAVITKWTFIHTHSRMLHVLAWLFAHYSGVRILIALFSHDDFRGYQRASNHARCVSREAFRRAQRFCWSMLKRGYRVIRWHKKLLNFEKSAVLDSSFLLRVVTFETELAQLLHAGDTVMATLYISSLWSTKGLNNSKIGGKRTLRGEYSEQCIKF